MVIRKLILHRVRFLSRSLPPASSPARHPRTFNRKTTERRQSNPFPGTIIPFSAAHSRPAARNNNARGGRVRVRVVCRLIKTNRPALMIDLKVSPAIPDIIKSCTKIKSRFGLLSLSQYTSACVTRTRQPSYVRFVIHTGRFIAVVTLYRTPNYCFFFIVVYSAKFLHGE